MNANETAAVVASGHPFELAGLGRAPFRCFGMYKSVDGTCCDYCSTRIRYVFDVASSDGRRFKVGCDCVLKTLDSGLIREVRRVKREVVIKAREESRAAKARAAADAFCAQNPGLADALAAGHDICRDMAAKLRKYGSLSEKQVAFAFKLAREAAAPKPEPERLVSAPINGGKRQTISGVIVSRKSYDSAYGTTTKITVKVTTADGGVWLAWGSVPGHLYAHEAPNGSTVSFDASLKAGRDEHFALFSRPTKASLLALPVSAKPERWDSLSEDDRPYYVVARDLFPECAVRSAVDAA